MSYEFDNDIRVSAVTEDTFKAIISDDWRIGNNANGGYLMSMMANAMGQASGRRIPIAMSTHFLNAVKVKNAKIITSIQKKGRSFTTVSATMIDDDKVLLMAIGTMVENMSSCSPIFQNEEAPTISDFEDCIQREGPTAGFLSKLDIRLNHEEGNVFLTGDPSGKAQMQGWLAFRDQRPHDALSVLLATDVFPPCPMNLPGPLAWFPTIQFSFYLRSLPKNGPLHCVMRSTKVDNTYFDEQGTVFDSTGALVAQSSQIALMPKGN